MLPSNKPTIPAFFHPLTITIDGKFEDATAAILKDIYDSEEEDDEDDEAIEVNANEEKTMKTMKPLKLMPMKKT